MPMPDQRTLFRPFRTSARTTAAVGRPGRRRRPAAMGPRSAMRLRRRTQGSALVLALMGGLVALIGALVLASRLFSSRFNSFSRSDTLAAREAAEYGLNQIQARLNANQFSYLWVTKKDQWGKVSRDALSDCQVPVLDANGEALDALPALPAELALSAPRQIQSAGGTTITYELTDFDPPRLPNDDEETLAQKSFCDESGSGGNFGNLNGGSALITVTGTVTRGNNTTTFKLRRRALVASSASASLEADPVASFIILGNAYKADDKKKKDKKGQDSYVTQLLSADGNICYGTRTSPSCFEPKLLDKTVIGCFDLGSCLINNVDLDDKTRAKNCQDIQPKEKGKSKTKAGFTCNDFQQIGDLPPVPLPGSSGMVIDGSPYQDFNWGDYSAEFKCKAVEIGKTNVYDWNCEITGATPKVNKDPSPQVRFPYRNSVPANLDATWKLTNDALVPGCYFSGVNARLRTSQAIQGTTTAINCLVDKLDIDNEGKLGNFIVHTANGSNQLLPVNIFLHGDKKDEIKLDKGGIEGNDTSQYGWNRLRILGKPQATADGEIVACDVSSPIVSKGSKSNDLDNLFLWLPNSSLIYDKKGTKENSFAVIWVCQFTGPTKDGSTKFSIITPFPEEVALAGVQQINPSFGTGFTSIGGGGVYRGLGSEDSPAQ